MKSVYWGDESTENHRLALTRRHGDSLEVRNFYSDVSGRAEPDYLDVVHMCSRSSDRTIFIGCPMFLC